MSNGTGSDIAYLLSPKAIRERTRKLYDLALDGKTHFRVCPERLSDVSRFVLDVTLENYPDLKIPFHSRWGHFQVGRVNRLSELNEKLLRLSPVERARAKIDLAIVSVLLDAGSGSGWKYREAETGQEIGRSEGLAVASLRMFLRGDFSGDPSHPFRADAGKLASLRLEELARGFQVSESNPLVGLEGRLGLLHELGKAVRSDCARFPAAAGDSARPGHLFDYCRTNVKSASDLLLAVLQGLGPIWPGRIRLGSVNLGDVWTHSLLGAPGSVESLVPFHKLSQWLTYSLIEPLEEAGVKVPEVEGLTGLAEYRNGGLLLDRGLIELRDPALLQQGHRPDSELIIEWRALTIQLLDAIGREVRAKLRKSETELPLAKVLAGGTWWAGRKAASALRADGGPPIRVLSDGTVF